MRLIDADALKKDLLNQMELLFDTEIAELIDKQPTSYDVEKVIEELSERIERVADFDSYDHGKLTIYDRTMIPSQLAIEIVERGGIDDKLRKI